MNQRARWQQIIDERARELEHGSSSRWSRVDTNTIMSVLAEQRTPDLARNVLHRYIWETYAREIEDRDVQLTQRTPAGWWLARWMPQNRDVLLNTEPPRIVAVQHFPDPIMITVQTLSAREMFARLATAPNEPVSTTTRQYQLSGWDPVARLWIYDTTTHA